MEKIYNNENERREIIEQNLPMVLFVIKKKRVSYLKEEIYDYLLIDYIKAIDNFDKSKGVQLSTYLFKCLSNSVNQYMTTANRKKRKAEVCSLNTLVDEDTELGDLIGKNDDNDDKIYTEYLEGLIEERLSFEKPSEAELYLRYIGIAGREKKTVKELSSLYKISLPRVYQIIDKMNNITRFWLLKNGIRP